MAKAKRYSTEQVETAKKLLRGLAAKKFGKTKKEVVELLAEDVRKAVQQGHSLKDIQETLGKAGIPVPLARIKALLGQQAEDSLQNAHDGSEQKDTAPPAVKKPATSNNGNDKGVSA